MRICPDCKSASVINDGYCGQCRQCTLPPLSVKGAAAVAVQRGVIWRFYYTDKMTGQRKKGSVTLEKHKKPDCKIAAVYGDVMDWNMGVTGLKAEPYNDGAKTRPPKPTENPNR